MKKILILTLSVMSLGFGAMAVASTVKSTGATPNEKKGASWLMVMHADSAKVVPCHSGKTCLSLQGVNKNVVAFTDRPMRKYHNIPTSSFIKNWDNKFKSSAPNASAVHADMTSVDSSGIVPAIVTLNNPQLKGDTLTFEIAQLNHHSSFVSGKTYQDVNLFVDSFPGCFGCPFSCCPY